MSLLNGTMDRIMSDFDNSRWSDSRFAQEYRDQADGYVPERHSLIGIAQSLYSHLVKANQPCRMLDLGCGDGLMVQELLKVDDSIDATLVDGSQEMLKAANNRLARLDKKHLVNASFQDLLAQDPLQSTFRFVLSSLAIHHLAMAAKETLFEYIYRHLDPGGFFLNIDVVFSPTHELEEWYLMLWQEWINTHAAESQKASLLSVPQQYKDNPDNIPDLLLPQLQALERIGFKNVDCFYKYGIFAMFGGSKPSDDQQ
jgi:tRNA (cmo5U34)-methyltransferase